MIKRKGMLCKCNRATVRDSAIASGNPPRELSREDAFE
jgi:hypothetical protein